MGSRTIKTLALAVLAGCSLAAHAEGLYAGGSLAAPHYDGPINGIGSKGGEGIGLKLYGGWQFTPNLALEGGYFALGRSRNAGGSARAQGLYVDGVGSVMFAPRWSLLGSVGLAQARLRTPAGSDNSPGLKLGVGVQYDLTPHAAVRFGYEQYHFSRAFDAKANVGQTGLSVKVGF